jgi:preprotein translocase subunit SecB
MSQEINKPAETDQPIFQIQRFYVKEQSCKVPQGSQIFLRKWEPEFSTEMQINHTPLQQDHYEVTLHATITAKLKGVTAFVADVNQAGLFQLAGFDDAAKNQLLAGYCPTVLLPYLRKVIADMTVDAGFPAFTLAPFNFEVAYQEQVQKAKAQQEKPEKLH